MIKILKNSEKVYQNVELTISEAVEKTVEEKVLTIDENGKERYETKQVTVTEYVEVNNPVIPQELEELRAVTIYTLSWRAGDDIKRQLGDFTKLSATNSKGLALIAKVIGDVDLSHLTDKERAAFGGLVELADNGYADSDLLVNSITSVGSTIDMYSDRITRAATATTRDELIAILEE